MKNTTTYTDTTKNPTSYIDGVVADAYLLMETGDHLLLETGDKILLDQLFLRETTDFTSLTKNTTSYASI